MTEIRRDETRRLPAERQRRLLRTTAWQWPRLTSPVDLLAELERDYDVRIVGKEKMPHDLWPAMRLPPLDFPAKLSLVLAGFHVTYQIEEDGRSVQISPMPESASLTRRYDAGANARSLAEQLSKQYAVARFRADGRELVVDGPAEVHAAIAGLLSGDRVRPPTRSDPTQKTYTLTVENKPVGGVMRALGQQLGLKVEFDVSVERRLTTEISLNVKEVSLDELLTAVLSPASLKFERNEMSGIRVFD